MTRSPFNGVYELRLAIANHLRDFHGMSVTPDQIVIGAGTDYLYGLLIQILGFDKVLASTRKILDEALESLIHNKKIERRVDNLYLIV